MDRQVVYPGSIPLDTDLLSIQRNTMVALGCLTQAVLGTSTIVDGLACLPTQPASMSVSVGPGCIMQLGSVDTTPFGSLPAMPTSQLVRIGTNLNSIVYALTAPSSIGQSLTYLIQGSLLELDTTPLILPYYNAANPGQPYSGPDNSATAQNTQRLQSVQLMLKPGVPVTSGAPTVPGVDVGWVGLYAITVTSGQTAVLTSNIIKIPAAPFVTWKLPQLSPGTHNLSVFQPASQGPWTVPAGVSAIKLRLWGGGGAGGSGFGTAGGGGAGGGYSEGYYPVFPGQNFLVSVGNGGVGSGSGGGTSSLSNLAAATGGASGGNGSVGSAGLGSSLAGTGSGQGLCLTGETGGDPFNSGGTWLSGAGGGAHAGTGAVAAVGAASASTAGRSAAGPGCGGSGGVGNGVGGQGGPGLVLVEW